MTEAEKDLKVIKSELLDKAYPDYFLHKKMTVKCPKCKKIVEVYEVDNSYGAKCECGFMNNVVRGL